MGMRKNFCVEEHTPMTSAVGGGKPGGVPEGRRSKGGCVNSTLYFSTQCGLREQGNETSEKFADVICVCCVKLTLSTQQN